MIFIFNGMRFGIELSDSVVMLLVLCIILSPLIFIIYTALKN